MADTTRTPRTRTILVFVLVLLPLVITAVIKYLPAFTHHGRISSVGLVHTRYVGPKEYAHLEDDASRRLDDALAEMPDLVIRDIPAPDIPGTSAGTDALIVPTLTVDAGIVQLNLQVIETHTNRLLFNTPYQSSIGNYPDMMKAAGAALKRALK